MDELAKRIEARLNEALDQRVAADEYAHGSYRALCIWRDNVSEGEYEARLSVADVARIAAGEARRASA